MLTKFLRRRHLHEESLARWEERAATSRPVQIELERIDDDKRISEKKLWERFEAVRPTIFSALLDGVACALRELPNVNMDSLPRMADAALWATAGEVAFGWERGTFTSAYCQNLQEGAIASVDAHPVGVTIRQLLEKETEWIGEPADLLSALNELAQEELRRARNWPQTPRALSARLSRLAQAFRRAGIEFESVRGRRRRIRLCRTTGFASQPSQIYSPDDAGDANDANSRLLHDQDAANQLRLVEEPV